MPIYCGETGENKDEWIRSFRELLDKHHIGWHFWPYKKVNNESGIVTFDVPKDYESFIQYAESPRTNFEQIRKARPADMQEIREALEGFLQQCRFKNCRGNQGYISALGFAE